MKTIGCLFETPFTLPPISPLLSLTPVRSHQLVFYPQLRFVFRPSLCNIIYLPNALSRLSFFHRMSLYLRRNENVNRFRVDYSLFVFIILLLLSVVSFAPPVHDVFRYKESEAHSICQYPFGNAKAIIKTNGFKLNKNQMLEHRTSSRNTTRQRTNYRKRAGNRKIP